MPDVWKEMLDLVNCKVLSVVESDYVDAYLLSESSMFVFPHKLILKTCGTTTLLSGLPRILEIAALSAGFPHIVANLATGIAAAANPYRVFYSRKNFLFPDRQRGPHRSWRNEVKSLDRLFCGGSAYMIGKMNGEHWYLYLTEPNTILTPPATPDKVVTATKVLDLPLSRAAGQQVGNIAEHDQDETLEVLMTDLEEGNAKQFYLDHASAVAEGRYYQGTYKAKKDAQKRLSTISESSGEEMHHNFPSEDAFDIFSNTSSDNGDYSTSDDEDPFPSELSTEGHALGTVVSETSGLTDIYPSTKYPEAKVDAYLFTPCGFSANGVIPAPQGSKSIHYFTVHVTPEPHCSYASFETNVPSRQSGRETAEIVEQIVAIFRPGRFSVTLFEAKPAVSVGLDDDDSDIVQEVKRLERKAGKKSSGMECIKGYRRVDRIVHELEGYELVFRYYERWDWKGGAPRLGEIMI